MTFPEHVSKITAEWLGSLFDVGAEAVGEISIEMLAEGVGFTSEVAFVSTDAGPGGPVPRRLVAKQCTEFETAARMAADLQLFEREARFYTELASSVPVRTPHCYFADYNPATERGMILLEDCSHYGARSQVDPVPTTLEEFELAVDVAVALNGRPDDPALLRLDWLFRPGTAPFDGFFRARAEEFPAFFESQVRDFLPDRFLPLYERLMPVFADTVLRRWPRDGLGLSHFDFRVDNFFFDEGSEDPLVLFDWQGVGLGRGPIELAYLLGASYSTEFRREHERAALERYCAGLEARGRTDYGVDDAWRDYRFGAFMIQWVLPTVANLDVSSERAQALLGKILPSIAQMLEDHGGLDLIDELSRAP